MKTAKIKSSELNGATVIVRWSDGPGFYFDSTDLSKRPVVHPLVNGQAEINRRTIVSRTSAQAALDGCEVQA